MIVTNWLAIACLLVSSCGLSCGQTNSDLDDYVQCQKSSDPTVVRQLRQNTIKQEILLRLHLDAAPDNPDPATLKKNQESIREEYNAIRAAEALNNADNKPCVEVETRVSQLTVLFPTHVSTPGTRPDCQDQCGSESADPTSSLTDTYRFKFNLDITDHSEVTKADLRLYKRVQNSNQDTPDRVEVFIVFTDVEKYYGEDLILHVTAQEVKPDSDGYVTFDVKQAIGKWKQQTHALAGEILFEVYIRTPESLGNDISFSPSIQFVTDNTTTQLLVTAYYDQPEDAGEESTSTEQHREKRQVTGNGGSIGVDCTVHPLVINFRRDFNWTWILRPDNLTLNYCSGVCGRVNTATTHSRYLSRLASRTALLTNPVASADPCCVPNKFESVSLAIVPLKGSNVTRFEELMDITITSCLCR